MTCLLVIPARGGSQGILRKNLQQVGGVSLVERAMQTAAEFRAVSGVPAIVSTDDDEIAALAVGFGVHRSKLHSDTSSSESIVFEALEVAAPGHEFTHAILMQCTSPFTQAADIRHVHDRLLAGAECVVTVTPSHDVHWMLDPDGVTLIQVPGVDGCNPRKRRQDRPALYRENGALYGMRVDLLRKTGSRFCGRPEAVMMPKYRSPEIDDGWDLDVCRRMHNWPGEATPWRDP